MAKKIDRTDCESCAYEGKCKRNPKTCGNYEPSHEESYHDSEPRVYKDINHELHPI